MQVDLVTRAGCHLCDEALAELRALGVEPRLRDVDEDPDLFTRFDFRVPVLLVGDRVVGEGTLDRAALARALGLADVQVVRCGPEAAEIVHRLTQAAFADHSRLDPPSGAGRGGLDAVVVGLGGGGGALALVDGRPLGCLRMEVEPDHLHVRRVAVDPAFQGRGIGRALMRWAESEALDRGLQTVTVGVRLALESNLAFYRGLGYGEVGRHAHPGYDEPTWLTLEKLL